MKIFLATDHAGFALKETVKAVLADRGYDVEDVGAHEYDESDDYPLFIGKAAAAVVREEGSKAVIFGGSGQGEAIVANRVAGVRAVVYYGEPPQTQTDAEGAELSIIAASRVHNDANVLSLGARFLDEAEAVVAVEEWLGTEFAGAERHRRRIEMIDNFT